MFSGRVWGSSSTAGVTPAAAGHRGPLAVTYFENRAAAEGAQGAHPRESDETERARRAVSAAEGGGAVNAQEKPARGRRSEVSRGRFPRPAGGGRSAGLRKSPPPNRFRDCGLSHHAPGEGAAPSQATIPRDPKITAQTRGRGLRAALGDRLIARSQNAGNRTPRPPFIEGPWSPALATSPSNASPRRSRRLSASARLFLFPSRCQLGSAAPTT